MDFLMPLKFFSSEKRGNDLILVPIMMKLKYFLAFAVAISFYCSKTFASTDLVRPPVETGILMLPNASQQNWKSLVYKVDEKGGIVEYIPSDQTVSDISDLITIMFYDTSSWDRTSGYTIEKLYEHIVQTQVKNNPDDIVTWKILEKNGNDIIYEYTWERPNSKLPLEHEVVRVFLTDTAFHRIAYTHKHTFLSASEKKIWINILKQNSSVVPIKDAAKHPHAFSLLSRALTSVDLSSLSQNWKLFQNFVFENGFSSLTFVPSSFKEGSYVDECFEVTTFPCIRDTAIDQIVAHDQEFIQSRVNETIEFDILQKTPTEVIYWYSHPKDHLRLNAIVRTYADSKGYRSLSYKQSLEGEMKRKDILFWKSKLEAIAIQ